MKIKHHLQRATQQLHAVSDTASLDAMMLLSYILQMDRLALLLADDQNLTPAQSTAYETLIAKRAEGIPIAYLTGKKAFWTLDLQVNQHTLIPRPETELVVETALNLFPAEEEIAVADLGTGSGAIALAIASERSRWTITAVDISDEALQVAQANAQTYSLKNIRFVRSDWLHSVSSERFSLIVSNPPYLAEDDPHLTTAIRYEPQQALVSGPQGLEAFAHLIAAARSHLLPNGWLVLEHGYTQAAAVRSLFAEHHYTQIHSLKDLAAHERVTLARCGG